MTKHPAFSAEFRIVASKLRRYARLLVGQQEAGDRLAADALATLLAAPGAPGSELRIRAFAELTRLYRLSSKPQVADELRPQTSVEKHLSALTDEARQAFLLVAVEEFSPVEAAQVLNVSQSEFEQRLQDGRIALAQEIACDVLIIEDELFIATDIERAVTSLGHLVVSIERTHSAACKKALELRPSLILADIKLADDSSGIDAVNDILDHHEIPVVFITAYPERLLTGLRPEPTYLVTKPFTHENLRAVVSQALLLDVRAHRAGAAAAL